MRTAFGSLKSGALRGSRDVFPDSAASRQFFAWLQRFPPRKRLLDTPSAATYAQAGILSLLTTNPADYAVFGVFTTVFVQRKPGLNKCRPPRNSASLHGLVIFQTVHLFKMHRVWQPGKSLASITSQVSTN